MDVKNIFNIIVLHNFNVNVRRLVCLQKVVVFKKKEKKTEQTWAKAVWVVLVYGKYYPRTELVLVVQPCHYKVSKGDLNQRQEMSRE